MSYDALKENINLLAIVTILTMLATKRIPVRSIYW